MPLRWMDVAQSLLRSPISAAKWWSTSGRARAARQTLAVAPQAKTVYAVEPIANLRDDLKDTADITMSGHVFGDAPEAEYAEMARITKPGGQIILCPGSRSTEDRDHRFLVDRGFNYQLFEQPRDGICIKYWLTLSK